MNWDVVISGASGGFIGSAVGMIYCLKAVIRMLKTKIAEDPDIDKIEINVHMNETS